MSKTIAIFINSNKLPLYAFLLLLLFQLIFSTSLLYGSDSSTLRNFKLGDLLPQIKSKLLSDGKQTTFTPGKGKPSVIMFFSIRPDFRKKRSLAMLNSLSDLADQYGNRINVVGVYSDKKDGETVVSYTKSSSLKVDVFNDPDKSIHNSYGVFMMPLVVIADKVGKLHEVIPYTFNIRSIVDGNIKLLLGEWTKSQLLTSLKPKETAVMSDEEKEYIRRINYGKIMASKKMYPQAIREFSTATKIMPKKISAHIELGFTLIAAEKFMKAEESFIKATLLDPESDDAISGQGLALYGRGDMDNALSKLESAFISMDPRIEVVIALADIYEKKGNNNKANRLNKLAVGKLMKLYEQRWK